METAMAIAPPLRRPVDPLRVARGLGVILGLAAGVLALEAKFPATAWGMAGSVAAGIVLVALLISPLEWLVHRCVFHRPLLRAAYDIHHRSHHHVFFPTSRYVTAAAESGAIRLAPWAFAMASGLAFLCVPVWLLTGRPPLLMGMVTAELVATHLMVAVHDAMHRPGIHPRLEGRRWFRLLDRHHYIHHVDTEANVNFLLPLADWLFGTLRTSLTGQELERHGPWERTRCGGAGSVPRYR